MISTTAFALLAVYPHWHCADWNILAPPLLLCSYYCMIKTLQSTHPEGYAYYSYFLLICASFALPQILWLIPALIWSQATHIGSLTPRSLAAMLLGMLTPIVMLSLYHIGIAGRSDFLQFISEHLSECIHPDYTYWKDLLNSQPSNWSVHNWQFVATALCLLSISIVSTTHFLYTALKDKLRVRTFYNMLFLTEVALWVILLLYPQQREALLFLLSVNCAPFIAHYFTLSRGWMGNLTFALCILTFISLIIFNYNTRWILSLIFS